jgi:o-succinylbenzoate---CoA ligase
MFLKNLNKNIDYFSVAVIANNKIYSYADLEKFSNNFAEYFYNEGIREKNYVPLFFENNLEFILAVIALWKLGAVPVPLNVRLAEKEISELINFIGGEMIIADKNLKINFSNCKVINPPDIFDSDNNSKTFEINFDKNNIALILFTSGSSGKPKGVMLSFDNLIQSAGCGNLVLNHTENDRWLASLPFYHIGGFSIIFRAIIFGASMILPASLKIEDISFSIKNHKPTLASFVTTQLQRLIENKVIPNKELRTVLVGGGFINESLINNSIKNGWKISKVYGSTETSSFVSILPNENISSPRFRREKLCPVLK